MSMFFGVEQPGLPQIRLPWRERATVLVMATCLVCAWSSLAAVLILSVGRAQESTAIEVPEIRSIAALLQLPTTTRAVRLVDFDKDGIVKLARLRNLRRLEIRGRRSGRPLTDPDCDHLARLTKLEVLLAADCRLTAAGFAALARLPMLRQFEFSNQSQDPDDYRPLAKFVSLTDLTPRLDFAEDGIRILDTLAKIRPLRRLCLPGNVTLTSTGLQKLAGLTQLRELDLHGCHGLELRSRAILADPALDGVGVDDKALLALAGMVEMRRLDLASCYSITGRGLAVLTEMPRLGWLDLSNCSEVKATSFASLPESLHTLLAQNTRIDGRGLARLNKARRLDLSRCMGLRDDDLRQLQNAPIRDINLTSCKKLTAKALPTVLSWSKVERLNLFGSRWLEDSHLASLATMTQLRRLNIGGNLDYSDAGLAHLASLKRLEYLNILACKKLTTTGIQKLTGLPLRELVVTSCRGLDLPALRAAFPGCHVH